MKVPEHHGRLAGQERPDKIQAFSTRELRAWERTGEKPFGELVREVSIRDFADARYSADLEARLVRHGLRVKSRGRGMVVTDGRECVTCGSVAREASRAKLEKHFGERYVEYCRERGIARETKGRDGRANSRDCGRRGGEDRVNSEARIRHAVDQATADLAH
jgi:hypothetical protein